MANLYTSLVDPIFWVHHGNLDRVWWSWQSLDLDKRLTDIGGPNGPDWNSPNITLDFPLELATVASPLPVRDIMDIRVWPWCTDYDEVYPLHFQGLGQ